MGATVAAPLRMSADLAIASTPNKNAQTAPADPIESQKSLHTAKIVLDEVQQRLSAVSQMVDAIKLIGVDGGPESDPKPL
jgi:hypothetical protein